MDDHRCIIKLEVSDFHGVSRKAEMNINYFPNGCCDIDSRIVDFFSGVYQEGMLNYHEQMDEYFVEQNKKQIEETERIQLAKLKEKYEPK